jgi:hypothetical protein
LVAASSIGVRSLHVLTSAVHVTDLNDFVVHVFINVHNGCFVAAPASQYERLLSTLTAI